MTRAGTWLQQSKRWWVAPIGMVLLGLALVCFAPPLTQTALADCSGGESEIPD